MCNACPEASMEWPNHVEITELRTRLGAVLQTLAGENKVEQYHKALQELLMRRLGLTTCSLSWWQQRSAWASQCLSQFWRPWRLSGVLARLSS